MPVASVGLYAAIIAAWAVARSLGALGYDQSVFRFLPAFRSARGQGGIGAFSRLARKDILRFTGGLAGISALVVTALAVADVLPMASLALVGMALLNTVLVSLTIFEVDRSRSLGHQLYGQVVDSLVLPLTVLAGVALFSWLGDLTLTSLVSFHVVASALSLALLMPRSRGGRREKLGRKEVAEVRSTSRGIFTGQIANSLALRSPQFILVAVVGPAASALYEAAYRLAVLSTLVGWSMSVAIAPHMAEAWQRGDTPFVRRTIQLATLVSAVPPAVLLLVLASFGDQVLSVLGSQYQAALPAALILTSAALVDTATGPLGTLFNITGNQTVVRNFGVIQLITLLAVGMPLTSAIGLNGMAVAVLLSTSAREFGLVMSMRRRLGFSYWTPGPKPTEAVG